MALYYYSSVFASIFLGTIISYFLTSIMGNPRANLLRAFFFSTSKIILLYFFVIFFSNSNFFFILLLCSYYLLFLKLYQVPYVNGLRFIFFSSIFSIASKLILVKPVAKSFMYLL